MVELTRSRMLCSTNRTVGCRSSKCRQEWNVPRNTWTLQ